MSITPPLGDSRYTRYEPDSSATGEQVALHVGRLHNSAGDIPVVFFHDYLVAPVDTLVEAYGPLFTGMTTTSYPVLATRLGGTSMWANPSVVDPGGWVDDAIDWAAANVWIDTRADKVAVVGVGMGSLNALNWAWRNPGKVLAVVLIGPIVDADAFYDDNPALQAAINASWGSGAAWTAALPDIDPMQNLDLIRPFAHRIGLWYGDAETEIDDADVRAFAELTGATATEYTGTSTNRYVAPGDAIGAWLLGTIRDRRSVYVAWNETDWTRFDQVALTLPPADPANTNETTTAVWPGGRRGEFHRLAGTGGNERWAYLLAELSTPDSAISTVWFQQNGGLMVGQHGNIHRGVIAGGTYNLFMTWGDIFGVSPWIVNMGVWTGTVGGNDLTLHGNTSQTIPGLRLSAGGQVLASERLGGVVRLVVDADDLSRNFRSRTLDVEITGPLGDHIVIGATQISPTEIVYPQAGGDIPNGGAGSWADFGACYPFNADTDLVGDTMRGRFYPRGMDPPTFDDPDYAMTWTDSGGDGTTGYGLCGAMFGHVGIFDPGVAHFLQLGRWIADER